MISTPITSTGMRQTQNLVAPPTQNTAPVLEFKCLYTTDLRRKQKRWQDGFLRFHTFNKRIMVYEAPSRNYIGDKHWRESEAVEDGDEIQLEKPVLVQVGEQVGTMETDLTELLEKRKKPVGKVVHDDVDSSRRPGSTAITYSMSVPRQPLAQPSQLQPKTLNSLLGTPKRPIGRASLPTKSPHELRHEGENADWGFDRPAKRQRIEVPQGIATKQITRPILPPSETEASCFGGTGNSTAPSVTTGREHVPQPAPSLHKTVNLPQPSRKSPPSGVGLDMVTAQPPPAFIHKALQQKESSECEKMVEFASSLRPVEKPQAVRAIREESPRHHINESRIAIDTVPSPPIVTAGKIGSDTQPIDILSEEEAASTGDPPKAKMRLQMASRKPRKKLMYRDLLPPECPSDRRPVLGETHPKRRSRAMNLSSKASTGAEIALVDSHQEEQDHLANRMNNYNGRASRPSRNSYDTAEPRVESFELFVSQGDPIFPNDHVRKVGLPEVFAAKNQGQDTRDPPARPRRLSETIAKQPIPKAASTTHDTALTLSKMDEILFPRSRPSLPTEVSSSSHATQSRPPNSVSSSPSIPVTPPRMVFGPTPQKISLPTTLLPSSPGFQTQSHASPRKSTHEDDISFRPTSATSLSKAPLALAQCLPKSPPVNLSSNLPQLEAPSVIAPPLQATNTSLQRPGSPSPKHPPPKARPPNAPLPPKPPSPKRPLPKPSSPKSLQSKRPSPQANPPDPHPPDEPTPPPAPPDSQPPSFPLSTPIPILQTLPTHLPEGDLLIAQKPLPAFQAQRPKPKPKSRSPLKKSTSDTSTMRPPPPALSNSRNDQDLKGEGGWTVGTGTPWTKEAWDLFGCGRDGVECSYEEFKRKEGLM